MQTSIYIPTTESFQSKNWPFVTLFESKNSQKGFEMLPFLKNRDDGIGQGPVEVKRRKPDEPSNYDALDAVAEDLMTALHNKDKGLLRAALEALCAYVQEEDMEQDQLMEGE